jgi:isopenicillin N synthase-like dioxygenase
VDVPVVDLARTDVSDLARARAVAAMDEALGQAGMFTVVHHGVHPRTVARAFDAVRTLFDQPSAADRFVIGVGGTRWPDEIVGFRDAVTNYLDATVGLMDRLLAIGGLALGRDDRFLRGRLVGSACAFVAAPAPPLDGVLGLLATDGRPALEMADATGAWHPVTAPLGAFVVSAGEPLAGFSGGRWRPAQLRTAPPVGDPPYARRLGLAVVQGASRDRLAASR